MTGLCKLASHVEIEEQDWSLNPGRYVGVVIADDGKTEEEFIESLAESRDALQHLIDEARELEAAIASNIEAIVDAE